MLSRSFLSAVIITFMVELTIAQMRRLKIDHIALNLFDTPLRLIASLRK